MLGDQRRRVLRHRQPVDPLVPRVVGREDRALGDAGERVRGHERRRAAAAEQDAARGSTRRRRRRGAWRRARSRRGRASRHDRDPAGVTPNTPRPPRRCSRRRPEAAAAARRASGHTARRRLRTPCDADGGERTARARDRARQMSRRNLHRTRSLEHDAGEVAAVERRALAHVDRTVAEVGVRLGVLNDSSHALDALSPRYRPRAAAGGTGSGG